MSITDVVEITHRGGGVKASKSCVLSVLKPASKSPFTSATNGTVSKWSSKFCFVSWVFTQSISNRKVAAEVAQMEREQLRKMNELEERKKRKSQIKHYLKECKSANVVYPSIISSLTQNSLTDDKVLFFICAIKTKI